MGSLLSTVTNCYLEPPHGIEMAKTGNVYDQYKDCVVKFQSLSLINPILLGGKKVFLYRPLSQHLHKIKSVQDYWMQIRAQQLRTMLNDDGIWNPSSDLELIAYHWVTSVKEMMKHQDVLWIQSNEFFQNKQGVIDNVCAHFGLPIVTDYSLSPVNVKHMDLNGKDHVCEAAISDTQGVERVTSNHGIILTSTDDEILEICETVNRLYRMPHITG
jgi:hypothetical protein